MISITFVLSTIRNLVLFTCMGKRIGKSFRTTPNSLDQTLTHEVLLGAEGTKLPARCKKLRTLVLLVSVLKFICALASDLDDLPNSLLCHVCRSWIVVGSSIHCTDSK